MSDLSLRWDRFESASFNTIGVSFKNLKKWKRQNKLDADPQMDDNAFSILS